jgi:hypothetical protein
MRRAVLAIRRPGARLWAALFVGGGGCGDGHFRGPCRRADHLRERDPRRSRDDVRHQGQGRRRSGKGTDTFSIQTASGYSASGTLAAGDVQVG